jgi:uncharacterized protein with PIN domain
VILYLDTSALVKIIVKEEGADVATGWFEGAGLVASSVVTYPESCAALEQNDRRRGAVPAWHVARRPRRVLAGRDASPGD